MPQLKLLSETTEVPAEASATEIMRELVSAGALEVTTHYRDGRIHGLHWRMPVHGTQAHFVMPARESGVYQVLASRYKTFVSEERKRELWEQAHRIAWRHLLKWVQAQIAIVRTGVLEPGELFAGFLVEPGSSGQTLFQAFVAARGIEDKVQ